MSRAPSVKSLRRKRKLDSALAGQYSQDSNVSIKDDAERRVPRALQQENGPSGKKKKRLQKYLDTKARHDESRRLLRQLEAARVDVTSLKPSRRLGQRDEPGKIAIDQSVSESDNDSLTTGGSDSFASLPDLDGLSPEASSLQDATARCDSIPEIVETSGTASGETEPSRPDVKIQLGSGLKRPLDGHAGPLIRKRQRVMKPSSEKASIIQLLSSANPDGESSSNEDESDSDDSGSSDASSDTSFAETFAVLASQRRASPTTQQIESVQATAPRRSIKEWAEQQINEVRDFAPSVPVTSTYQRPVGSQTACRTTSTRDLEPLPAELTLPTTVERARTHHVTVQRTPAIVASRQNLPIVAEEQKIMEAIHNNHVILVRGATGSGKTTQVPQFLYEAGYGDPRGPTPGMIGVTQPRRVAAVAMAKRVGDELNDAALSAYQIRFDSSVGARTAVKFMTDGILIREISQDFILSRYSVIIIDEAHERSVNTDILIGMVSRIVDLRQQLHRADAKVTPLKLIIMSATLMTDVLIQNELLFRQYKPPIVESEGRQHSVTIHFSRRTQRDYIDDAYHKIMRGHRKLPRGSMLVFLTGQREIKHLQKRLRRALGTVEPTIYGPDMRLSGADAPVEAEDLDFETAQIFDDFEEGDDDGSESDFAMSDVQDEDPPDAHLPKAKSNNALILPLYSQLPTKEQLRVFEKPSDGSRLIVLATNVAETSLTIPGIRYVFDCGRAKAKTYNSATGVQNFTVDWISKASAAQRAGRAGRDGPGHCYRLYSSAVYERDFPAHSIPEIFRVPIEDVVLQLKSMDLTHIARFPFPSPPNPDAIVQAERLLSNLGALDRHGSVTALGHTMGVYPVSARVAKMLAIGHQHDCMQLTVALVAALAVPELFLPKLSADEDSDETINNDNAHDQSNRRLLHGQGDKSDALKLLAALSAYIWAEEHGDATTFCSQLRLRPQAMQEASQLYRQILKLVANARPGLVDEGAMTLKPPSRTQIAVLKQIIAAAFLDQIAIRADLAPGGYSSTRRPRRAIDVPYLTLAASHQGKATELDEAAVYIHSSSVLARRTPGNLPEYVVYARLHQDASALFDTEKTQHVRMHPLTDVTGPQIAVLGRETPLLEYGKPIGKVETVAGQANERIAWVVPSLVSPERERSWPLPAVKVRQQRQKGVWITKRAES